MLRKVEFQKVFVRLIIKVMSMMKYVSIFLIVFNSFQSLCQTKHVDANKQDFQARRHLENSLKLYGRDQDSALAEALKAKQDFPNLTSVNLKIEILLNLGDNYKFASNFTGSLNYYLQAKKMVDEKVYKHPEDDQLNLLKADTRIKIGTLYLQLKNFSKSLFYEEEALTILEKANKRTHRIELVSRKLKIYNNIAAVFISQKGFETALVYFRNALELNQIVKDSSYESSLLNNIGICHLEQMELDLASHYFQKSLKIREQLDDKSGQAQVLNNLGKNEVFRGDFKKAFAYFYEALKLNKEMGNDASTLISLESLSSVSDTLGNYKNALIYYKEFKALNDQIFNLESKTEIASLESIHQSESDKKTYELKLKQNESDKLRNLVLFVVLLFILALAVFIIVFMRSRIKTVQLQQEKLTLESDNMNLAHRALEIDLELKERELTAKALFLLKNTELLARVTESLKKIRLTVNKENQQYIQEIIMDLQSGQHNNGWDEFEFHFIRVHSEFYESLQQKFPTLTSNEKKLCAFLRLNMSTKDISAITNQSVNSITVARTRLRKKLKIDGEDIHLINFLMSL